MNNKWQKWLWVVAAVVVTLTCALSRPALAQGRRGLWAASLALSSNQVVVSTPNGVTVVSQFPAFFLGAYPTRGQAVYGPYFRSYGGYGASTMPFGGYGAGSVPYGGYYWRPY